MSWFTRLFSRQPHTALPRDMPEYVINGNLYDALGPAILKDVVMHSFCIHADGRKLQAWLDRTFAEPSNGAIRYEAVGNRIFLGIAELGHVTSEVGAGHPEGFTREIDVTYWILARRKGDGFFTLRWIPAYLFVDSGPVLVTGRELWGFPKQLSRFDFSPQSHVHGGARRFHVDGWVVDPFAVTTQTRWAPIIEVRPAAATPPGEKSVFQNLEALADALAARAADAMLDIATDVQGAVAKGEMTMAFLKQFPDAASPHKACYQAIVEAMATVEHVKGSGLTDDHYEVRITSYDSHPFAKELGLAGEWHDVGRGFWMDFAFRQNLGENVWMWQS